jgi:protein-S-isoprenylcysteine O-methyltransferase Ste14
MTGLHARRIRAALGSLVFLVIAPGVVGVLVPWLLTGWDVRDDWPWPMRLAGAVLVCVGAAALVEAFVRFVLEGIGTPAPVAPTERLVVGGLYRYVRNPMYLAVGAIIVGQALLFGSVVLVVYAAVFAVLVVSFVRSYEEPTLTRRYSAEYDAYRRAVPGWWPRRTAWRPDGGHRGLPDSAHDERRA